MSLYDSDKEEIKKMINERIKETPEIVEKETRQILIVVIGVVALGVMLFGTICFGIHNGTERKKYDYQIQTYGEIK